MNVYIMYKFDDFEIVKKSIDDLEKIPEISVFYFTPDMNKNHRWKGKAKEKIKSADAICYFFNFETAKRNSRNLRWEYNFAVNNNKKIIVIDTNKNTDIINELKNAMKNNNFFKDIFNYSYDEKEVNTSSVSFEQGQKKLIEQSSWKFEKDVLVDGGCGAENEYKSNYYSLLIEQYKIMVDTSEKMMERRQATSNLYTTVCTALVALVGSAFALSNMFALGVIFLCVGIVSIILSSTWRHALDSYNKNNEGKFAVLNEIEKKLPANMFDSEYRYNKSRGIKSFAIRERMLPKIFTILGFIFLACGVLFVVLKCMNIDFFT